MGRQMGTILRVDLSTGGIEHRPLDEHLRARCIGGRGINSLLLFHEIQAGIDPLSPENPLIFGAGPLSGTAAPSMARFTVTAKSPLTGILGDANAGGRFGPALKRAGVDHLVITGRAEKPVYLHIDNGTVEIRCARHLWGTTTRETEAALTQELGGRAVRVASIGQAGEHLVRIAGIMHEDRSASRTGVGAVMGSKNLKAVAVRGTGRVPLDDPQGFAGLAADMHKRMAASPVFKGFRTHAGIGGVVPTNTFHILASKNFQRAGEFEGIENFNAMAVAERYYGRSVPCYGCPIGCRNAYVIPDGPFAGERANKVEEGAFTPLGPVCGNSSIESILKMNNMANGYGIDMIELGQMLATVMDWYEHGVVTAGDLDGIDMRWGDYHAMMRMMDKIAFRQGIGDVLAEGIVRAAPRFGNDAPRYVSHAKGMTMAGIEMRMIKGSALGFATSTRGADHLRGLVPAEFSWFRPQKPEDAIAQFGTADVLDPLSYNKASAAIYFQHQNAVIDMLEVCFFAGRSGAGACPMGDLARLFSLATGIAMDEPMLLRCGERVYNVERAFLCREGIRRTDDRLIGKWADEPLPNGPYQGERIDPAQWETMLDDYYRLRGWDCSGVPTREKLEDLGLGDVAQTMCGHCAA